MQAQHNSVYLGHESTYPAGEKLKPLPLKLRSSLLGCLLARSSFYLAHSQSNNGRWFGITQKRRHYLY